MAKIIRDTYTIELPYEWSDIWQSGEDVCEWAIREARERARLYVSPCEWRAELNAEDGIVVVNRFRGENTVTKRHGWILESTFPGCLPESIEWYPTKLDALRYVSDYILDGWNSVPGESHYGIIRGLREDGYFSTGQNSWHGGGIVYLLYPADVHDHAELLELWGVI